VNQDQDREQQEREQRNAEIMGYVRGMAMEERFERRRKEKEERQKRKKKRNKKATFMSIIVREVLGFK
jgi:hypothetical protein